MTSDPAPASRQNITCVIEYDIQPWAHEAFAHYSSLWAKAIPACGADLMGYFGPHEGSATKGYGIYSLGSLAEYEAYKARLREHPLGQEAFAFAKNERFIRYEDRTFLKRLSGASS